MIRITIFVLLSMFRPQVQPSDPDVLLRKLQRRMNGITVFNYTQYRHYHYKDDNYDHKDTMQLMFDFAGSRSPIVPKHQVRDVGRRITYIYNNSDLFILNDNNRALDVEPDNAVENIAGNNYFRQSYANLRAMLPEIITDSSLVKTSRDSIVQGIRCSIVTVRFPGKRLNALNGFYDMGNDSIRWIYEIYIDRNMYLPKAFNVIIERPAHREDYITCFYASTNSKPVLPGFTSFNYSAYRAKYPNHTAKRKDQVKTGSRMPDWVLPVYTNAGTTDTLRSASFAGQPTLLVFWTKNCGYCMAALPKLNALQARLATKGVKMVAINCGDPRQDIGPFKDKYNTTFPMCYNGSPLSADLGLYGYPMTLMVDKDGNISDIAVFDDKRN